MVKSVLSFTEQETFSDRLYWFIFSKESLSARSNDYKYVR